MHTKIKPNFKHSDGLNLGQKTGDFRNKELKEKGDREILSIETKQGTNASSLFRDFSAQFNDLP